MATSDKTTKPGWKVDKTTQKDLAPPPANPSPPPSSVASGIKSIPDQERVPSVEETHIPVSHVVSEASVPEGFLRDELTPQEGTDLAEAMEGARRGDRSQFKTAPGGGKNRISGGRVAAAAYVSPVTLPPATGNTPVTSAIKVHQRVKEEVRSYVTEPSLLRRRESSLPPEPPGYRDDSRKLIVGLGAALVVALLMIVYLVGFRETSPGEVREALPVEVRETSPSEVTPAAPAEDKQLVAPARQVTPEPALEKANPSPTAAVSVPFPESGPSPAIPKKAAPRPAPTPVSAPTPAPTPVPAPASVDSSNEHWLE